MLVTEKEAEDTGENSGEEEKEDEPKSPRWTTSASIQVSRRFC